jgi:PAS domain S-box-containing protein
MSDPDEHTAAATGDGHAAGPAMQCALAMLQGSPCAMALTDAQGTVRWCNTALLQTLQCGGLAWQGLALGSLLGLAGNAAHALGEALQAGQVGELRELQVACGLGDRTRFRPHLSLLPDGQRVVTLLPVQEPARQAQETQRLRELLDLAQDFGRLGVWERDVRTLQGRWDRHTYRFWGLPEGEGTPDFTRATQSVVAEDRVVLDKRFRDSIRQAGTYSCRYRVRSPDGVIRSLHSQWQVKNGADGQPERVLGILMDDTESWNLARSYGEAVEQLALAVDLGGIAIWRNALDSTRVRFNERAFDLLGLDGRSQELSVDEVKALIHPDDQPQMQTAHKLAMKGERPVDMEARLRHADGTWRHLLTRRVLQRDAQGQAVAMIGVALDLSERVYRTKRQTELMRQFELTARAAGIGYWSVEAGSTQVRWSEQTYVLHGLPAQLPAPVMAAWLTRFVHPDDRDAVRQRFRDWVKTGAANLEQEFRILRSDGSLRHVLSHSRLEGAQGRFELFGVLTDVTERRAAEAALHEASERAALATRGAGVGTWELELRSGRAYWDEQMWRLRGLAPQSQAPSFEQRMALLHPDDREATERELRRAVAEERVSNTEFRVRWPDGQWRWLASRSIPVHDEQGAATRRIGVNWDITDTRTAQIAREEKALAQRESQAKSQFLSRMSHELRTPLNAVLGFAQLLLVDGEKVSAQTRTRRLEQIHSAGQHLLSLINDVLELSSLEGGELRVAALAVPLAPLVAETLPLVEKLARQRKVKLRTAALQGVALADPTRLRQVLLNLLTNAVKYNREGGTVTVESEPGEHGVVLRVSDTGRGMSEVQVREVFEPFNRLGLEREGIEGTGIGLSIVKALVERMGGSVQVYSTPGQGSRFEVHLGACVPAVAPAPGAPMPQDAATPPATRTPGERARLLYIEDNPVNVLIVQELVAHRPNLSIDIAPDGLSGVSQATHSPPDLILVDMQLPDIDGLEVLRRLRAQPETAGIPCISLSANAMPEDIERALQAGFADYWTKPLDFRLFMSSLDSLFGPLPDA